MHFFKKVLSSKHKNQKVFVPILISPKVFIDPTIFSFLLQDYKEIKTS
jgi:hypothetical protein